MNNRKDGRGIDVVKKRDKNMREIEAVVDKQEVNKEKQQPSDTCIPHRRR